MTPPDEEDITLTSRKNATGEKRQLQEYTWKRYLYLKQLHTYVYMICTRQVFIILAILHTIIFGFQISKMSTTF